MLPTPPAELVARLERLQLADGDMLRRVARWVGRKATQTAHCDAAWVDGLLQLRCITPSQAQWLHQGQDDRLRRGPWLIRRTLAPLGYAECFEAERPGDGHRYRLVWIASPADLERLDAQLAQLAQHHQAARESSSLPELEADSTLWIESHGRHEEAVWFTTALPRGGSLGDWLARHGSLPTVAVEELARRLTRSLELLAEQDLFHGDLRADTVWLQPQGKLSLSEPGVRPLITALVPLSAARLTLAECTNRAPEAVSESDGHTAAADVYALGLLLWQALTGRNPIPGATVEERLRLAKRPRIEPAEHWVQDVPGTLRQVVSDCLQLEPQRRPSLAELASRLGPSTVDGRRALRSAVVPSGNAGTTVSLSPRRRRRSRRVGVGLAVAAVFTLLLVATQWSLWKPVVAPAEPSLHAKSAATHDATPVTPRRRDPEVVTASWNAAPPPAMPEVLRTPLLELPAGDVSADFVSQLQAGHHVRGAQTGKRTRVVVPPEGVSVRAEGVTWEQIDFVAADSRQPVLIRVLADETAFHQCTFELHSSSSDANRPTERVAIDWVGAEIPLNEVDRLTTARMEMRHCVIRGASEAVRVPLRRAVVARWEDVLVTNCTTAVSLVEPPAASEPLRWVFQRCTMRDVMQSVRCAGCDTESAAAVMEFIANDSVVELMPGGSLVRLCGERSPARLLDRLLLQGQGSIVAGDWPLVVWETPDGRLLAAADEAVRAGGWLRGEAPLAPRSISTDSSDRPASRAPVDVAPRQFPE